MSFYVRLDNSFTLINSNMTFQTLITILVFTATIFSFIFHKIPMATSAIAAALILVITGCVETNAFLGNIANNTVITMVSMFVVTSSLNKTRLVCKLIKLARKVPCSSFTRLLAAYVLLTFALAQFIPSITATFTIIAPFVTKISRKIGIEPSKIIFSIGLVTVSTSFTIYPIGPLAGNFIEDNGYLTQFGAGAYKFNMLSQTIVKIFPSIFILIWAIFIAPKLSPENMDFLKHAKPIISYTQHKNSQKANLKLYKEILAYIIFSLVIISLLFNCFGLSNWIIPSCGAVILVFAGILKPAEAIENMNLEIVLLYIGVITIGSALASTGAGQMTCELFSHVFMVVKNSYVVGFFVFLAAFILTSLVYNRAVGKVLVPFIIMACVPLDADPRGLMCICYTTSMLSLITPMSNSIVPIMMGTVGYDQIDILKMGLAPGLIAGTITVAVAMTIYPCF
ncbi:MAG: hypothetical protein HUJ51_01190 [Eggerthellaceae bacterium]|nr:hypothetical protein [Eggerthellaceae bacterium]